MFRPNIFTNGHAEFFAAQIKWFDAAGRFEITIFVKHIIRGEERLVRFANRFACFEQSGGVMKRFAASVVTIDETDQQRHFAHTSVKLLKDFKILRNKTRFKDEILRRIPRNGQLRCQDQFRSGSSEALVSAHNFLKIAAQIPDGGVNLSKTNLHAALQQIMCNAARSNSSFGLMTSF